MNNTIKNLLYWLVFAVVLIAVFNNFSPKHTVSNKVSYSQFLHDIAQGKISSVTIENQSISGISKAGASGRFSTYIPLQDPELLRDLLKNDVEIVGKPPEQPSVLFSLFVSWFPLFLIVAIWVFLMRQQMGGGRGGAMSFGRSRARLIGEDQIKVTFKDVAGVDEAKEEVEELVDYLKEPSKYQRLGGRIPSGVLLVGAPGTGKTLLARAVAGEAKVPFFSISGSDFVEMFVGVGASRVRDMFEQAKKQSPCIIFIDEIDAVGRHRGAGLGGGHDEREQTLNQLLVEMDGFQGNEGVIVVAATNRPDVLDPALLRPGRFDRQVTVPLPDIRGREQIMTVHLQKVPIGEHVDAEIIARGTPGFSGADLANLVNEAALFAARDNKKKVNMVELERAKDKIIMGAERHSMVMNEDEKRLTAYHEAGHAIVGLSVPDHDPVHKVTIIPRGRALGVTMFLPTEDRYSHTRERLQSQLSSLFGGRIAEALIFGDEKVTTGASNDIKRATDIARAMVTKWGLSSLGAICLGEDEGEIFLGSSMAKQVKEVSEATAEKIDAEVKLILDKNYVRAESILKKKIDCLHKMAEILMQYETIDSEQIDDVMNGRDVREPKAWQEVVEKNKKDHQAAKASKTSKAGKKNKASASDKKDDASDGSKES